MQPFKLVLVALLVGTTLAGPAVAAGRPACLQNNRIWGWQAVNDRTLIVTDRSYRRFTVNLRGGCIGLDKYAGMAIMIMTKTRLGCVSSGDNITFDSPGLGPLSCSVAGVRAGVPSVPPEAH